MNYIVSWDRPGRIFAGYALPARKREHAIESFVDELNLCSVCKPQAWKALETNGWWRGPEEQCEDDTCWGWHVGFAELERITAKKTREIEATYFFYA